MEVSSNPSLLTVLENIVPQSRLYLSNAHSRTLSAGQAIPPIELPAPQSLIPILTTAGVSSDLAIRLEGAYQFRASELRRASEISIAKMHRDLTLLPSHKASLESIVTVFKQLYEKKLEDLKQQNLSIIKSRLLVSKNKASSIPGERTSKSFNYEYVPLLEHFFEENPFPSHADKAFLARKSGMSYKQIHVWFQNRRSRTKKEGKILRKKPMSEGLMLPMDNLCRRMARYILPQRSLPVSEDRVPNFSKETSASAQPCSGKSLHPFDCRAPVHAYPAQYPPSCLYNPFPINEDGLRFITPQWPRQRNSTLPPHHLTSDIDSLVDAFAQLSVRDDNGNRIKKRTKVPAISEAATCSITVRPYSAPLPALVRCTISRPVVSITPLPSVRRPSAQPSAFDLLGSGGVLPFLPSSGRSPACCRKYAPLPRRAQGRQDYRSLSRTLSSASSPPRNQSPTSDSEGGPGTDTAESISSCATTPTSSPIASTFSLLPMMPPCIYDIFGRPHVPLVI